jgi:hypothetical protein
MDVSELTALVGETPVSLAEVEYVFRALVGYPDEEGGIEGASTKDLVEALQRSCNALIAADDRSELPYALWRRVIDRAGGDRPASGGTYSSAAALIIAHQAPWEELFRKYAEGAAVREG